VKFSIWLYILLGLVVQMVMKNIPYVQYVVKVEKRLCVIMMMIKVNAVFCFMRIVL